MSVYRIVLSHKSRLFIVEVRFGSMRQQGPILLIALLPGGAGRGDRKDAGHHDGPRVADRRRLVARPDDRPRLARRRHRHAEKNRQRSQKADFNSVAKFLACSLFFLRLPRPCWGRGSSVGPSKVVQLNWPEFNSRSRIVGRKSPRRAINEVNIEVSARFGKIDGGKRSGGRAWGLLVFVYFLSQAAP